MPTYKIIKLKQLTPLHLGTGKENQYDFSAADLHSDTLTAALAAIRAQQGETSGMEDFHQSFTISSAFPYWDDIYFLPKSIGKIKVKVAGKDEKTYRNQINNLKYIDVALWNDLVRGNELMIEESQLKDDFLLHTVPGFEKPYKSQVNQRVNLSHTAQEEASSFFFNWKYFHKKAGLYCLTDATGELFEALFNLFKLLGESGLGTDRNTGGGKFEVEAGTLDLPDIPDANHTMLLSLYIPTKDEVTHLKIKSAQYRLLLRGGFMAGSDDERFRHLRKRSVYMFAVGSLFPVTKHLTGKIVNLAPVHNDERMHPVFRSGRPFCLPVKISE